ncbi:MAG: glucose-1-phosphate adenylyltransferase subunit GlgD [Clostridia bacterium]|nr:glucose-1-phosphate adenylyltransferase subunit GlgD [Clostridia bacterium]
MKDVMGLIYTSKNETTLRELTIHRAVAALPVAGRYRMIDFTLSNMVNSGIRNVGVIMQKNYHSLMDHLGSGKEWDLHTRQNGLFILPPFSTRESVGTAGGILEALHSNMNYLRRSTQELVILVNSHTAMNTTFEDLLAFHEESEADITMVYSKKKMDEIDQTTTLTPRHVFLGISENGLVTEIEAGPRQPKTDNFYMDILVMRRELLIQLVDDAYAQNYHDFNRDVLQRYVANQHLRICGYEYKGYNRRVETINSYYALNMDLIKAEPRRELFGVNPVFTKIRDEVPARYMPGAKVVNSLVADGCVIEGTVENSVLFRGVYVGPNTHIKNSILMQEDNIEEGVELEGVILDKQVTVKRNERLIAPTNYPIVIGKNTTI